MLIPYGSVVCDDGGAVRNRMKSVKNIQKITKAMKMVAASKLRAVQTRAENSRGLWQPFTALLGDATSTLFSYTWWFFRLFYWKKKYFLKNNHF